MAIIEVGNFNEVSMSMPAVKWGKTKVCPLPEEATDQAPQVMAEAVPTIPTVPKPPTMELMHSPQKWALYMKKLTLTKNFEGWLARVFDQTNEIYFTVVAWDYSGNPPQFYPMHVEDPSRLLHKLKPQGVVEFMGDGVCLWPSSTVVGALNLLIVVYECDRDIQKLGQTLTNLHEKVKGSSLMDLIAGMSKNPTLALGVVITQIVEELSNLMGGVLQENGDDSVDVFSGSYAVEKDWESRLEKHVGTGVEIQLEFSLRNPE